jgi:hypothetical protein
MEPAHLPATARAVATLGEAVATASDRPDGPDEVLRGLRELVAAVGHSDGVGTALRSPEYRAEHAALGLLAP